jgi:hypothetical protein
MKRRTLLLAATLVWLTFLSPHRSSVFAQGTAFTYQGRLAVDGAAVVGNYDFQFTVCDAVEAWGDYDNDGRLDALVAGFGTTELRRNTGAGFTNVTVGFPQVTDCSVAWGDCDNDGGLDFLIAGTTNGHWDGPYNGSMTEVWRNTGSGFANLGVNLPGIMLGAVAWADYDNDGRLDIALTGTSRTGDVTRVFRNQTAATNSPPTAPTGLAANWSNGTLLLSWNVATDSATPSAGLTYNVRAGTTPGGIDLISPQSAANGFRRLPAMGNAQLRRFIFLEGLTNGQKVYWSVQAVDSAFAGGPFAPESSFTVAPSLNISASGTTVTLSWPAVASGWVLQEASRPGLSGWSNSLSGSANPVILQATNAARFYRLVHP